MVPGRRKIKHGGTRRTEDTVPTSASGSPWVPSHSYRSSFFAGKPRTPALSLSDLTAQVIKQSITAGDRRLHANHSHAHKSPAVLSSELNPKSGGPGRDGKRRGRPAKPCSGGGRGPARVAGPRGARGPGQGRIAPTARPLTAKPGLFAASQIPRSRPGTLKRCKPSASRSAPCPARHGYTSKAVPILGTARRARPTGSGARPDPPSGRTAPRRDGCSKP
jgi:hypothetical protein